MMAAEKGHPRAVELLILSGADLDAKTNIGCALCRPVGAGRPAHAVTYNAVG